MLVVFLFCYAFTMQNHRSSFLTVRTVAAFLSVLGVLAIAAYFLWPQLAIITDPAQAEQFVRRAGAWGPIVFIAMQVAQVFFAPIPGQVTGFLGGYLFGTWLGTLYAMIGSAIGFTAIFALSRYFGRPLAELMVPKDVMKRFDYLSKTHGVAAFMLIFLLPAFPDDLICYLAGLTVIRLRTLIAVSLIGRLPGSLVLAMLGAGVADAQYILVAITAAVLLVLCIFAYWQRAWLEGVVKRFG
jgi:uncharacterized membrane protein YdjX (TVP38/TMEM64 family)